MTCSRIQISPNMAQKLKKKTKQKQVIIKKVIKRPTNDASAANQGILAPKGEFVEGIGRRKTAVARVRVYAEAGDFIVNGKPVGEYFKNVTNSPVLFNRPFHVTETLGNWAVYVKVSGSGLASQLDAVVHGLARALVNKNEDYKLILRQNGLLTRDPRMKETRKIGMGGKARRKRQSPKR